MPAGGWRTGFVSVGTTSLNPKSGGADPGDRQLLVWADSEQRVLVTMDKDFGKLIFASGETHSGVVRLPDVPAEARIGLMEMLLTEHEEDLRSGAVITVKGDRIRISRPEKS